jgi:hypothetical protein
MLKAVTQVKDREQLKEIKEGEIKKSDSVQLEVEDGCKG